MEYKTIGIRVLDDSNILDRLKVAAKKHDMSYAELVNYWLLLDEAEPEPAQLSLFPTPPPDISPKIADFETRILALEETVSKLSQSLQAFIEKMNPVPVENLFEAKQESPEMPFWKIRLMENLRA